jgi:3-oxoacyl-[acyl-carrier protein] reductase
VRKYVAAQKELDLLVHCAAVKRDAPISMITEADWDAVLATDVGGAFRMAQAVQPLLQRSAQGHAVFIGSYSALSGPAGQCAYAASKAALLGFSRSLAREWAPHGIRVNAILPGWLETKFTADVAPEIAESVRQQHLLGKFNSVEDVAAFLLALQSLLAISGQIFQLDSRVHPGF